MKRRGFISEAMGLKLAEDVARPILNQFAWKKLQKNQCDKGYKTVTKNLWFTHG